jgi:hypothetical protein
MTTWYEYPRTDGVWEKWKVSVSWKVKNIFKDPVNGDQLRTTDLSVDRERCSIFNSW